MAPGGVEKKNFAKMQGDLNLGDNPRPVASTRQKN
jgi:hypothetical protein